MSESSLLKNIDASIGSFLCRVIGCFTASSAGATGPLDLTADNIKNILVIRPGGIGDMIVLLPVITRLKRMFPDASIDIACQARNQEVLSLVGMKESAFAFDSHPIGFLSRLRKRNYDAVVDSEQFHHFSAIFSFLSGAPVRIGFKINPRRNPLYTHLINYAPDGPEGAQFLRLLEPLGETDTSYTLAGSLSDAHLPPNNVTGEINKPYAVIHPGSSSTYKLWPIKNFEKLAEQLHSRNNLALVVVGDCRDEVQSSVIIESVRKAGGVSISRTGKLDLAETSAILKNAAVFIGSDSGLAHLAVALGTPTVTLFGPSDHLKWGTEDKQHVIVRSPLPCSPCFIFGYHKPCRTISCMKNITVEAVGEAVDWVLK